MRKTLPFLCASFLLAAGAGCSNNVAPNSSLAPGLLRGTISGSDFAIKIEATGSASHPIEGPFVLNGSNAHYDERLGAMVVDMKVTNQGRTAHPGPIGLTFLTLRPGRVSVMHPDRNLLSGASITFQFGNHDGTWRPGQSSMTRTVSFHANRGEQISFVARLDCGEGNHDARVDVTGTFTPPDTLLATSVHRIQCDNEDDQGDQGGDNDMAILRDDDGGGDHDGDNDGGDDQGDDHDGNSPECNGARVRGPVTAIDHGNHMLTVMNASFLVEPDSLLNNINAGSRLEVHIHRSQDTWVADHIAPWSGTDDQLQGQVDAVDRSQPGRVLIQVLGTWVALPDTLLARHDDD